MKFWSNLIGYQLVWFVAVIGAGCGNAWAGVAAAAAFVIWQALVSPHPWRELGLMIVALVLGLCVDGGLAMSGWVRYAAAVPSLPSGGAPLWILALWASFAMTLNHSLAYLRTHPWVALAFGAIGGPLAYSGAGRGWQVIVFVQPAWRGLAWLAVGWAVAMPILATLARHWLLAPQSAAAAMPTETP